MSNRLDQESEARLQPKRIKYAISELNKIGITDIQSDKTTVKFKFKGEIIFLFPYSGWYQGKGVTAGRGIISLIKQLKHEK